MSKYEWLICCVMNSENLQCLLILSVLMVQLLLMLGRIDRGFHIHGPPANFLKVLLSHQLAMILESY